MPTAAAAKEKEKARQDAADIKAYIAALKPDARRFVKTLRKTIRSAAPDATEMFSYRMPGFRLDGKVLIWYAGFKEHCSLFPMTDSIRRALADEIEGYETSKGTIRFPLSEPPPTTLVKRLVKARAAELRK